MLGVPVSDRLFSAVEVVVSESKQLSVEVFTFLFLKKHDQVGDGFLPIEVFCIDLIVQRFTGVRRQVAIAVFVEVEVFASAERPWFVEAKRLSFNIVTE